MSLRQRDPCLCVQTDKQSIDGFSPHHQPLQSCAEHSLHAYSLCPGWPFHLACTPSASGTLVLLEHTSTPSPVDSPPGQNYGVLMSEDSKRIYHKNPSSMIQVSVFSYLHQDHKILNFLQLTHAFGGQLEMTNFQVKAMKKWQGQNMSIINLVNE